MVEMVKIASGKEVPVGSTGTAQDGKYEYVVLPNGSIYNINTGKVTAEGTRDGVEATTATQDVLAQIMGETPPDRPAFGAPIERAPLFDIPDQQKQAAAPIDVAQWAQLFETLPDCADEDGTDCRWDAKRMGNGMGKSFVNLGGVTHYEDGTVNDAV